MMKSNKIKNDILKPSQIKPNLKKIHFKYVICSANTEKSVVTNFLEHVNCKGCLKQINNNSFIVFGLERNSLSAC